MHRALRMRFFRASYGGGDAHPEGDSGDFTKGHAGLRHAEGAGVHAQIQHIFLPGAEFADICFVAFPCVVERIVGVGYGGGKLQGVYLAAQFPGGGNKLFSLHAYNIAQMMPQCKCRLLKDAMDYFLAPRACCPRVWMLRQGRGGGAYTLRLASLM